MGGGKVFTCYTLLFGVNLFKLFPVFNVCPGNLFGSLMEVRNKAASVHI